MERKVTVIIPYKEDRGWLNQAIESVKSQSYKNIELLLCQGNALVGVNLNAGIAKANGEFIKYLCDDDLLTPDSIKHSVKAFAPGIDFIHGCAENFWPDKTEIYTPPIKYPTLAEMLKANQIHGGTVMYRASVFRKFGFFDTTLWTGEEYDYNLRLLSNGATLGYSPEILYRYRRHGGQKSLGNTKASYQAMRKDAIEKIRDRYR